MVADNISHCIYLLIPEYWSITNSLIICIHFCRKDLSYFVNKYCFPIFDKSCINFYWTKMVADNISHCIYLLLCKRSGYGLGFILRGMWHPVDWINQMLV